MEGEKDKKEGVEIQTKRRKMKGEKEIKREGSREIERVDRDRDIVIESQRESRKRDNKQERHTGRREKTAGQREIEGEGK